jgi:hypothetical protein
MATIKLIITAKGPLQNKYGGDFAALDNLLNSLIPADANRAIQTKLFYIDDAPTMNNEGFPPFNPALPQDCKSAIDQLYLKYTAAYLVIFGAQDVFPFQPLDNPTTDEDTGVPSDLPYACDSAYSTAASTFTGPTRVVGRIPDIPGKGDINYVTTLIRNIIGGNPRPAATYAGYFAISAAVWQQSTQMSVTNIFGNNTNLLNCPPDSASTHLPQLKALSHFFNCHGANLDYSFYGQSGTTYPPALNTNDLTGNILPGTLAVAECCYGAQLIDGNQTGSPGALSIANNYFLNNALGFMGSSTIAYGPANTNDQADLITQFFFQSVLSGASLGRAMLEARQKYLTRSGPQLDVFALKTLAQFYLLGDPSVQLVVSAATDQKGIIAVDSVQDHRMQLYEKGLGLGRTIIPAKRARRKEPSKFMAQIQAVLQQEGFAETQEDLYIAKPTRTPGVMNTDQAGKSLFSGNIRFRTFTETKKAESGKPRIHNIRVLVVKENDDSLLGYKIYLSR